MKDEDGSVRREMEDKRGCRENAEKSEEKREGAARKRE